MSLNQHSTNCHSLNRRVTIWKVLKTSSWRNLVYKPIIRVGLYTWLCYRTVYLNINWFWLVSLCRPATGILITAFPKYFKAKTTMAIGCLIGSLSLGGMALGGNNYLILAGMAALFGVSFSMTTVSGPVMLADLFGMDALTKATGFYFVARGLGAFAGVMVVGYLEGLLETYYWSFLCTSFAFLLAAVILTFVTTSNHIEPRSQSPWYAVFFNRSTMLVRTY